MLPTKTKPSRHRFARGLAAVAAVLLCSPAHGRVDTPAGALSAGRDGGPLLSAQVGHATPRAPTPRTRTCPARSAIRLLSPTVVRRLLARVHASPANKNPSPPCATCYHTYLTRTHTAAAL